MKKIVVERGYTAQVDDEDFAMLRNYRWKALINKKTGKVYAQRAGGVLMHREIMGCKKGDGFEIDHREPSETLNNQKYNLRIATTAQNQANRGKNRNNRTGLKGVSRNTKRNCLQVTIGVGGKKIFLGRFALDQIERASKCYREAAEVYHGEFSRTL